jgi:outer membrane protein OmpA-like peptidoglycan-associated protein
MKKNPEMVVELSGHTDNIGSDGFNKDLSLKRAKSSAQYLVSKKGIDKNRILINGYGEEHPVATNETAEGRAKNRRTEIRILKR